jgi:hypothetical protein
MKTTCTNLYSILDNTDISGILRFLDENGKTYNQNITIPRDANGAADVQALRSLLILTMREVHRRRNAGELEFAQIS